MFDPGALLSRTYPLPSGLRVRLRLPHPGDATPIRALGGGDLPELELARLLRHDPRRRLVICATGLLDGTVRLVGVGALDLRRPLSAPTILVEKHPLSDGLEELLREALLGRARALLRARAA